MLGQRGHLLLPASPGDIHRAPQPSVGLCSQPLRTRRASVVNAFSMYEISHMLGNKRGSVLLKFHFPTPLLPPLSPLLTLP